MNKILVEVSVGELLDKISILEIKQEKIKNTESLKFIKLSRDVHFLNDDRAKIKLDINNHAGSSIRILFIKFYSVLSC